MGALAATAKSDSPAIGLQRPRLELVPPFVESAHTAADEAIRLGRTAGITLDPWQEYVLRCSLGERPDWKCSECAYEAPDGTIISCPLHPESALIHPWSVRDVALVVPRQNGKDELLMVRELYEIFILGSPLIIHSAHRSDAAMQHYDRLSGIIKETPAFANRLYPNAVRGLKRGNNEQSMMFWINGHVVKMMFRTRKAGGGRSFSADFLVLNEAFNISDGFLGDLLPVLSARPNPQVWFTSSAVNKTDPGHANGIVLSRIRRTALKAMDAQERGVEIDEDMAYLEWSAEGDDPDLVSDEFVYSDEALRTANPSFGIHKSRRSIRADRRTMGKREFAVEHAGIGDWFMDDRVDAVFDMNEWRALGEEGVEPKNPVVFSWEIEKDRQYGSISVAGWTEDGRALVEVIEYRKGTGWIPARLKELKDEHSPFWIVYTEGPAAAILPQIREVGLKIYSGTGPIGRGTVVPLTGQEFARACGGFYDGVDQRTVVHRGVERGFGPKLAEAVSKVVKTGNEAFKWSRSNSPVDISPLISVTLAHYGIMKYRPGSAGVHDPWELLSEGSDGKTQDELLAELQDEMKKDAAELIAEVMDREGDA